MRKYIPSINENNKLRDEVVTDVNTFLYNLEKGKHNPTFSSEMVFKCVTEVRAEVMCLKNAVGSGKEQVYGCYLEAKEKFLTATNASAQGIFTRFESAMNNLATILSTWKDVIEGKLIYKKDDDGDGTSKYKRLNEKLILISQVKNEYSLNETRIEKQILAIEKEKQELDDKIMSEENERLLSKYFREVNGAKSKIEALNIRRSNYALCYSLIDMIEVNIKELLIAGTYAKEELSKAKSLLNILKLRDTISNPEHAVPILNLMKEDIEKINKRVQAVDNKVFGNSTVANTAELSDAMKYKQSLLNKAAQSAQLSTNQKTDDVNINQNQFIKEHTNAPNQSTMTAQVTGEEVDNISTIEPQINSMADIDPLDPIFTFDRDIMIGHIKEVNKEKTEEEALKTKDIQTDENKLVTGE